MKVETHKEFGQITYVKSKRARSIRISMKPFDGIKVTVPWYHSFKSAENAIIKKKDWIHKNLIKIKEIENGFTVFDFDSRFSTRYHEMQIKRFDGLVPKIRITNGKISVLIQKGIDIKRADIQSLIRSGIEMAWRKEAKFYLPQRVDELASKYKFTYQNVSIRNSKTRWGSCSGKNNISLSLHLMSIPDHLIDHVILHELCHTIHKNHGKDFWKLLDNVSDNAKALSKELKKYRIGIY